MTSSHSPGLFTVAELQALGTAIQAFHEIELTTVAPQVGWREQLKIGIDQLISGALARRLEPPPPTELVAPPVAPTAIVEAPGDPATPYVPNHDDFVDLAQRHGIAPGALMNTWFREVGGWDHATPADMITIYAKAGKYYSAKAETPANYPQKLQNALHTMQTVDLGVCPRCKHPSKEMDGQFGKFYLCTSGCKSHKNPDKNLLWSNPQQWNAGGK